MKNILILIFILASLYANEAKTVDVLKGGKKIELRNGDERGVNYDYLTQVSLWAEINTTNISQFKLAKNNAKTLISTNPYEKILLEYIKYDNRYPSYAKITATHLILVFDTNDTATNGSLTIEDETFRDGDQGGALNEAISVATGNILDKAKPVIASYKTLDSTGGAADGYIDKIELTFSEPIHDYGETNKSFTVAGYTIPSNGENVDNVFTIPLTPKTVFDTDAKPNTTYISKIDSNITDSLTASGNVARNISTTDIAERDTTKALLLYVSGESIHDGGDKIHIGFSEPMTINLIKGRIKKAEIVLTGGGTNLTLDLTKATFAFTPSTSERNITITLNEKIDGAFIPDNGKPEITMEHNATDRNDNNFTTSDTKRSAAVPKETTAPKLSEITRVGENELKLTFNEPMNDSVKDEGKYTIVGVNYPGSTAPSIASATQSTDKESVTLKIDDFPPFSSTETRTITIEAETAIQDYVGNGISRVLAKDYSDTYIILKDAIFPLAQSFNLNMNTGEINISFDEQVAIGQFSPTKIDINISATKSIPLTGRSTATYHDKYVIISLNGDLDMVKNFLKEEDDVNLTIRSGSQIFDFASNALKGGNVSLGSSGFNDDDDAPKLVSWDYNLDDKKFTLLFNEAMKVGTYSPANLKINDNNGTGGTAMIANKSSAKVINAYPYRTIEISLLASQVNSILGFATAGEDINKTHLLILSSSGLTDSKGKDIDNNTIDRAKTWKSSKNTVANLKVIPNKWNHISVEHNTTSNDILSTGKVSYIYGHDGTNFVQFPPVLSSHKGYWIKTSSKSDTNFNVAAIRNIKGTKEDDLKRIRDSEAKLNLIGIDNNLTYEEIRAKSDTKCKYKRIHHYVSDTTPANEGWDVNKSVSANDALWVLCIK